MNSRFNGSSNWLFLNIQLFKSSQICKLWDMTRICVQEVPCRFYFYFKNSSFVPKILWTILYWNHCNFEFFCYIKWKWMDIFPIIIFQKHFWPTLFTFQIDIFSNQYIIHIFILFLIELILYIRQLLCDEY